MTGLYVGQALGGFGATIAVNFSWETAFHAFGMFGMLYAVVLIFFLKDAKREGTENKQNVQSISISKTLGLLFSNVAFWVILFYFAVPSLPGWAIKNWLPTLFSQNLGLDMAKAGPMSTITIAISSFMGVIFGGILSDRWVQKNVRGRVYTSALGMGLTIPAILLIGFGHSILHVVGAAFCFGFGFGMADANFMPILSQFVASRYRATAYGIMNMVGVFAGAFITDLLGKSTDKGNLGNDFAMLAAIVFVALVVQLYFLKPLNRDYIETS